MAFPSVYGYQPPHRAMSAPTAYGVGRPNESIELCEGNFRAELTA
jgi:hypothetical protein